MDPRLLQYYEKELRHLREMGAEFAERYPKVGGRLRITDASPDPYVEQLLQGFAFLAARVQLKVDAQFPRFSQHLLESVYPDYLAPTPSMAVLQFQPDMGQGDLREGPVVPRETALLTSETGRSELTPCEYRTAHPVQLWPLGLEEVEYLNGPAAVAALKIPVAAERGTRGVRAGLRLRLAVTLPDVPVGALPLERLVLFLAGIDAVPFRLYELLVGHGQGVWILPTQRPVDWVEPARADGVIQRVGFTPEEALLPYGPRSFQGYRLLKEYFALPERFRFVALEGLAAGIRRCQDTTVDLVVTLDKHDPGLENLVKTANIQLYCSPVINLFHKRLDRVHLDGTQTEHHAVLDRTRGMDFEIYRLSEVVGHRTGNRPTQRFQPFYASADQVRPGSDQNAYFVVHREPRLMSARQRRKGLRSADVEETGYIGSEVFVGLVDAQEAPYGGDIQQLAVSALCTNRDLPILWRRRGKERGQMGFSLLAGHPVERVRCLVGPTDPRPAYPDKDLAWRLISHLSLNYLSLVESEADGGAAALRDLLTLYTPGADADLRRQIDGLVGVSSEGIVRRVPVPGPIAFGRGRRVTLTLDESQFTGAGVFLLGAVMEEFFAQYASINCFTQTMIKTPEREVMTWPVRMGRRPIL